MQGVDPLVSQAADRKVLARYIGSISKTCYAEERRRVLSEIGAKSIEEFAQVPILRAERDARVSIDEERKHGRHQRWLGFAIGVPAGMILACGAIFAMQGVIWDTATRSFREQAMTGALISSHGEDERNESYTNPGQDVTRRP